MPPQRYALATIEGLHLTCDFVIYSAALFGCPPDYSPTRVGLHDAYHEPYKTLTPIPLSEYPQFQDLSFMDELTMQALGSATVPRMRDSSCIAWELPEGVVTSITTDPASNSVALSRVISTGEQILDIIRLFLFKPGDDSSIGRVGSLGGGVTGVWLGDGDGSHCQFIARKTSRFQLVQEPLRRGLNDVRRIYADDVFRELCSVVCSGGGRDDTLSLVLNSLRTFRESRDMQSEEARFLRLASMAEDLAKRHKRQDRLAGRELREAIADVASSNTLDGSHIPESTVTELWTHVRNPLTHSARSFAAIGRDAKQDIATMERLTFNMIKGTVLNWRMEDFVSNPTQNASATIDESTSCPDMPKDADGVPFP
jgi:hypothetical protein